MSKEVVLPQEIKALGNRVIGCAIEVHRHLGPGLLEKLYEEALVYELNASGLQTEQQVALAVPYKATVLRGQRVDLLVERSIVIEVKAVLEVHEVFAAQCLSYLRAGDWPLGLMNFHARTLRDGLKRICNERWTGSPRPQPLSSLSSSSSL
ncbi:MAG: GxxExxY protein [Phycisphaerales bacterium]|nr:GxxExxY protein [Phycisphaerales bacterium]